MASQTRTSQPEMYATRRGAERLRTLREVLRAYAPCSLRTRCHVAGRALLSPFHRLLDFVPESRSHLDLGCGHGIFCLLVAQGRETPVVVGVDPDGAKIAEAHRARMPRQVRLVQGTAEDCGRQTFQSLSIIDVLYLLPPRRCREVLDVCARMLAPGGTLLVKELGQGTPLQRAWYRLQEFLAVRVLRITQGEGLYFMPPEAIADELRRRGWQVSIHDIGRGYLHPHQLVVARKP